MTILDSSPIPYTLILGDYNPKKNKIRKVEVEIKKKKRVSTFLPNPKHKNNHPIYIFGARATL